MRYENPPLRGLMKLAIAIGGLVFLGCLILAASKSQRMGIILLTYGFIGGSILPILCWLSEYYFKPNSVEIANDGFVLEFRYRSPISAKWSDLLGIRVTPDSISEKTPDGTGSLIMANGPKRNVTATIAEELNSGYKRATGETLEAIWPGEGSIAFRRRIRRREGNP